MTAIGMSVGSVMGQVPATKVTPKTTTHSVQPAVQSKTPAAVTLPHKAGPNTIAISNKKPHVKPAHVTPVHPVKKDGTPDKRFHSNKKMKKDGTPDARYKENKPLSPGSTGNK